MVGVGWGVGVVFFLFLRGGFGRDVARCGSFLGFLLDGSFFLGFGSGAALLTGQTWLTRGVGCVLVIGGVFLGRGVFFFR